MFDADAFSTLDLQGLDAAHIANFCWFLFGLGVLAYLGVLAHLGHALFRRRRTASPPAATSRMCSPLCGGIMMPADVVAAEFSLTVQTPPIG
jgi:hypothetical protein